MINRFVVILTVFALALFFPVTAAMAVPYGKTAPVNTFFGELSIKQTFSNTSSTYIPISLGYGFTKRFEASGGAGIINSSNMNTTGYFVSLKYWLAQDEGDEFDCAFRLPVLTYSNGGNSFTQISTMFDFSKDMRGFTPFFSAGANFLSGPISRTTFAFSVGSVGYLMNYIEAYTSLGVNISDSSEGSTFLTIGARLKS
ncbi:MAG: hypothetical protein KKH83_01095 [Candidatus Margulisbacteria bacterium]|nr:hypothetical protein [Candidatus Margulisiibacteriota bacterium]